MRGPQAVRHAQRPRRNPRDPSILISARRDPHLQMGQTMPRPVRSARAAATRFFRLVSRCYDALISRPRAECPGSQATRCRTQFLHLVPAAPPFAIQKWRSAALHPIPPWNMACSRPARLEPHAEAFLLAWPRTRLGRSSEQRRGACRAHRSRDRARRGPLRGHSRGDAHRADDEANLGLAGSRVDPAQRDVADQPIIALADDGERNRIAGPVHALPAGSSDRGRIIVFLVARFNRDSAGTSGSAR